MRRLYPRLRGHELFVVWFLHATVTEDLAKAVAALTGNARDKGADAILIDDRSKVAFIVQGKYRGKVNAALEYRSDNVSFTSLAQDLFGSDDDYQGLLKDTDPRVHERFKDLRDRLRRRAYNLKLYYVTTGRCSKQLVEQAERAYCLPLTNFRGRHILSPQMWGASPQPILPIFLLPQQWASENHRASKRRR